VSGQRTPAAGRDVSVLPVQISEGAAEENAKKRVKQSEISQKTLPGPKAGSFVTGL